MDGIAAVAGSELRKAEFLEQQEHGTPKSTQPAESAATSHFDAYRSLVESITTYGVIGLTEGGVISHWNSGAEQIFHYSPQEVVGKHIRILFTEEDQAKGVPEKEITRARVDGLVEDNRWHRRKDGTMFWGNGVMTAQRREDGAVEGLTKVLRDNTKSRFAEEELRRSAKELARSNAELQDFAFVASHDLKEPLRTVSNYVQLLERMYADRIDETGKRYIHIATDSVKRMYSLINDLLGFAQIGTNREVVGSVDCNRVLAKALKNLEQAIQETGAEIHVVELPVVTGIESLLCQLFQNLIGNALKFRSQVAPVITITSELLPEGWLFSVADNGIGINPEYSERVFRLFQRLHSKEEYPGSGIGLTICKKIVEQHGGRIWFESEPGHGTTFYFILST